MHNCQHSKHFPLYESRIISLITQFQSKHTECVYQGCPWNAHNPATRLIQPTKVLLNSFHYFCYEYHVQTDHRVETRHSNLGTLTSTLTGSCWTASIIFVWVYNLGQLHVESYQHLDVETQLVCVLLVSVNHPTHLAAWKDFIEYSPCRMFMKITF